MIGTLGFVSNNDRTTSNSPFVTADSIVSLCDFYMGFLTQIRFYLRRPNKLDTDFDFGKRVAALGLVAIWAAKAPQGDEDARAPRAAALGSVNAWAARAPLGDEDARAPRAAALGSVGATTGASDDAGAAATTGASDDAGAAATIGASDDAGTGASDGAGTVAAIGAPG